MNDKYLVIVARRITRKHKKAQAPLGVAEGVAEGAVEGMLEMESSNSSDALLMNVFCHPHISEWKGIRDVMGNSLDQIRFGVNGDVLYRTGRAERNQRTQVKDIGGGI